ncbi:MAG: hypothetical protein ABL893_17340, partial [Hyphomicrobium sp.]
PYTPCTGSNRTIACTPKARPLPVATNASARAGCWTGLRTASASLVVEKPVTSIDNGSTGRVDALAHGEQFARGGALFVHSRQGAEKKAYSLLGSALHFLGWHTYEFISPTINTYEKVDRLLV